MKKQKLTISLKDTFRVFKMIRIPWHLIILTFLLNLAQNEVLLKVPAIMGAISSGDLSTQSILTAVGIYLVSFLIQDLYLASNSFTTDVGKRNARNGIWKRMLHVRLDYYDANNPSRLTSTMTNDVTSAIQYITLIAGRVIPDIYYAYVALKTIGSYNTVLMIAAFSVLPIKILYAVLIGKWNYTTHLGVQLKIGTLTGYLSERIKHLPLIKTNTNTEKEVENGQKVAQELYEANIAVKKFDLGSGAFSTVVDVLQNIIVVVFGVMALQKGEITIQQWVAFFIYSGTLFGKFTSLLQNWISLKYIQGCLARTAQIMNAPAEKAAQSYDCTQMPEKKDIEFENVSFSYGNKQALKNVSFTVKENTLTAIVGLCGSGKTTSLNLIEGFYCPDEGQVRIGGQNVQNISADTLRSNVALIHQGAGIFSGTVREAMTYGMDREISDEEIMAVARKTGADSYIEKCTEGLDTEIAAYGSSMSGGQRQRLVLTRELLKQTDIMLLDEPTAALDALTAEKIKEVIHQVSDGMTVVMVTHDLTLVDIADQIIVMDSGNIVGCGTYGQLIDSCQLFGEMVRAQKRSGYVEGCV